MRNLRICELQGKIAALLGALLLSGCASAQQVATWKAGQFKVLLTGKATRKDVARVLGDVKPTKSGKLETYSYADKGEFGGKVLVDVNAATGVVEAITEQFSPNLTRTQAYKKYWRERTQEHHLLSIDRIVYHRPRYRLQRRHSLNRRC